MERIATSPTFWGVLFGVGVVVAAGAIWLILSGLGSGWWTLAGALCNSFIAGFNLQWTYKAKQLKRDHSSEEATPAQ